MIVLSNHAIITDADYNIVCSDIPGSISCILNYFKVYKKTKPALYGTNPNSMGDICCEGCFLKAGKNDIYQNTGSLKNCFNAFYKDVDKFD